MRINRRAAKRMALLGLALALAGCGLFQGGGVVRGSGRVASEARSLGAFNALALDGSGEVVISQGASEALTIEAEDNILPLLTSQVQGGTLRLGFDRADWQTAIRPTRPIRYEVTVRQLETLELAGAGSLRVTSLEGADVRVLLNGAGDVQIDSLQADSLTTRLAGTGSVNASGAVQRLALTLSGTGDFNAGDLESQTAEVALSGTGNATLWVRGELSVLLSGVGSVSYFGTPSLTRRDITGVGDINPMGDR